MNKIDLGVSYAGLSLRNPIIISSSGLTETVDKVKILEKSGAGAVVLKSLFEEQIMMTVHEEQTKMDSDYPEAFDFLRTFITTDHVGKYLQLIKDCKAECTIPVIASINCYTMRNWTEFALQIQEAGADALEVNIMLVDTDKAFTHGSTELLHIQILAELKKILKIPVIMKLSRQFTNLVGLANQIQHNDGNAIVLFNRPYTPDINIKNMSFMPAPLFTEASFFHETLRWTGIISGIVPQIDIAASGGIHNGDNLIKILLAGAKTAEICSVIYKEGPDVIPHMLTQLTEWMNANNFDRIDQFRGKLNFANFEDENYYERTQFMKYFSNKDTYPPM
ncbi:MAG: dihydroorotate dehydrogenase-like protein [Bacteroidales bacterium]